MARMIAQEMLPHHVPLSAVPPCDYPRPRLLQFAPSLLLILCALVGLAPFAVMVVLALRPSPSMTAESVLRFDRFVEVWRAVPLARFLANSLFVAGTVTALRIFLSALCGYAFARMNFRGRDLLLYGMLLGVLVPAEARTVPSFVLFHWLGWLNTYSVQIFPRAENALTVLLFRQYFLALPRELEDAASIDGCGPFRTFWHVALPCAKPVLAVAALSTFLALWNDFAWPLVMTSSTHIKPIQVGLALLSEQRRHNDLGLLMTATLISVLPVWLLAALLQRHWMAYTNK